MDTEQWASTLRTIVGGGGKAPRPLLNPPLIPSKKNNDNNGKYNT